MSEQTLGIKETRDLLALLKSIERSYVRAKSDNGKIDLNEYFLFFDPATKIPAAIDGIEQIPKELLDIDNVESAEIQNQLDFLLNTDGRRQAFSGLLLLAGGIRMMIEERKAKENPSEEPAPSIIKIRDLNASFKEKVVSMLQEKRIS